MRLGIFGGTFDPPHIGHLVLADEAMNKLKLEMVLWVLTQNPPHKQGRKITDLKHRLKMVQAAISGNPKFTLSRVDIDRPPPHYAVDTVKILREENKQSVLVYLLGSDSLDNLSTWYQPTEFVNLCDEIGVMRRPGVSHDLNTLNRLMPGIGSKIKFFEAPLIGISATQIRERIIQGFSYRYFVPSQIHKMINEMKIYEHIER